MKYIIDIITLDKHPEDHYKANSWPESGVYEISGMLYFVDKAYGSVNSVYGNYQSLMTKTAETGPQVDKQLLLEIVAATHGNTLKG
jgi:hypothetical protein